MNATTRRLATAAALLLAAGWIPAADRCVWLAGGHNPPYESWADAATTGIGTNYHSCTLAYSCASPLAAGAGNLDVDPRFADANADYRLQSLSPCVNAGTNLPWMVAATDLTGKKRLAQSKVDMGAYELPNPGTLIVLQ